MQERFVSFYLQFWLKKKKKGGSKTSCCKLMLGLIFAHACLMTGVGSVTLWCTSPRLRCDHMSAQPSTVALMMAFCSKGRQMINDSQQLTNDQAWQGKVKAFKLLWMFGLSLYIITALVWPWYFKKMRDFSRISFNFFNLRNTNNLSRT